MFYMPGTKMLFGDAKDTCEGEYLVNLCLYDVSWAICSHQARSREPRKLSVAYPLDEELLLGAVIYRVCKIPVPCASLLLYIAVSFRTLEFGFSLFPHLCNLNISRFLRPPCHA